MTSKRIIKNTMFLYIRQLINIIITLYSMRAIFNGLGLENYGVYTVVAGFVTLLSFLPGSMASATQRFFSFAMGERNLLMLKKIFCVNLIMYASIALLAYIVLQTVG